MDRTKLGIVAAITSLAAPAVAPAQTFAELLAPIPDAATRLQLAGREAAAPQLTDAPCATHHHGHMALRRRHHVPPRRERERRELIHSHHHS